MNNNVNRCIPERLLAGNLPKHLPAIGLLVYEGHYLRANGCLFDTQGNLFPGVWVDPVGFGSPYIWVAFDDRGEQKAFLELLSEQGTPYQIRLGVDA